MTDQILPFGYTLLSVPKSSPPTIPNMQDPPQETVLVVGATGNIGVSVVIASLRQNKKVLAIVRNPASAEKLFKHVGTRERITTIEADVTSDAALQEVVEKVKRGELPDFQHVYTAGMANVHLK